MTRFLSLLAAIAFATAASAQDVTFPPVGGADPGEPFVTVGNTGGLSAERSITAGSGIAGADGGANSTYTLDLDPSELTADTTPDFDDIVPGESSGGTLESYAIEALAHYVTIDHASRRFWYYNELTNNCTSSPATNDLGQSVSGTGAATSATTVDADNHPSIILITSGTTSTGRSSCNSTITSPPIAFGGGAWTIEVSIRINNLSDGTDSFSVIAGFFDTLGADQADAAAFVYENNGGVGTCADSANWQRYTASNSVRTCNASSTAVGTGWTRLRVEVNADASSVEYFVDGASIGTETTNIPTGTARALGFGVLIQKSVGTTARTVSWDYVAVEGDFTTPR